MTANFNENSPSYKCQSSNKIQRASREIKSKRSLTSRYYNLRLRVKLKEETDITQYKRTWLSEL